MTYELIVAIDENNGIGLDGKIPWKVSEDMEFFKSKTEYNVVVMGYKTFESLRKPLCNRLNVVLTRKNCIPTPSDENLLFVNDIDQLEQIDYTKYKFLNKDFKKFIIGGTQIYDLFFDKCETFWITQIKNKYVTDTDITNIIKKLNNIRTDKLIIRETNIYRIIMYKRYQNYSKQNMINQNSKYLANLY